MKRCVVAAILGIGLVALHGCSTAPRTDSFALADGQELPVLRETGGTSSSFRRSLRLVVHDPGALAMLPIDVGPVDFAREMVLVAALGPTPSDQYAIRIQTVWRDGASLRAAVEVTYPPADAPLRTRSASPYHVVVVPRSPLNVRGFQAGVPPALVGRSTGAGS